MTSAPPTKVAAAATKGEVVVSADRQRMKLSRDAKNTVQPSAAARPIIRKSCGRTRSPASATPPSTIRTAPVISPACTGSSSSVIAIATDTSGAVPTTTETLAAPESWIARKKSTCETPGANSPARKNANVSPSGTPSPAIAAASAQTTNPTNTLTSAPSSASPPCRRPILIATEVAPKRKAEAHARATAVTSGEPIRLARMERVWIVGGGSIGSLLAAHLSRVTETWVLCRRPGHADALEANGLRVSGRADFLGRPRATADPAELPPAELAIVATKATDVEAAAARLADAAAATPR